MPRPPYRITQADLAYARRWIENQQHENRFFPCESVVDQLQAERELKEDRTDPEKLDGWCRTWLSAEQWRQMKDAIRSARRRKKNRHQTVGIEITAQAHRYLAQLANRDQVTISEIIERHLRQPYLDSLDEA